MSYKSEIIEGQLEKLQTAIIVMYEKDEEVYSDQWDVTGVFGQVTKWNGTVFNAVKKQELKGKYDLWMKGIYRVIESMNDEHEKKLDELQNAIDEEMQAQMEEQNKE